MPEPLFILCPGRSFSSVVSTVIGQHPQCYGLPELNLFLGATIGEAWKNDATRGGYPMQGLKRTIAEVNYGAQTDETVDAAIAWIREREDWTARQMMDHIQEKVGDRILVDKSPANVVHPRVLGGVVKAFPNANYLQLMRHPRTRGKSQMKHWEKTQSRRMMDGTAKPPPDAEFKWQGTHAMISTLGSKLALGQLIWIRGEDLMRDLRFYLPQICEWLGIGCDAAAMERMLKPEESPYACLGPTKAKYGANTDFLKEPSLDFERLAGIPEPSLDGPLDWAPEAQFSDATRRRAHRFGYR